MNGGVDEADDGDARVLGEPETIEAVQIGQV